MDPGASTHGAWSNADRRITEYVNNRKSIGYQRLLAAIYLDIAVFLVMSRMDGLRWKNNTIEREIWRYKGRRGDRAANITAKMGYDKYVLFEFAKYKNVTNSRKERITEKDSQNRTQPIISQF